MGHPDSVDDAISEIFSLSLARRKDMDTLWVHPLVHSWSRERLDQAEKARKALHAISLVAAAVSVDRSARRKVENWVKERSLLPHIQRCVPRICRNWSAGNIDIGASQRDDFKTLAKILPYHASTLWLMNFTDGYFLKKRSLWARTTQIRSPLSIIWQICSGDKESTMRH